MKIPVLFALPVVFAVTVSLRADVDMRLSIKIVADAAGNIPSSTRTRMLNEATLANRILAKTQRGYGFDLYEVVTLQGVSQWYDSDPHDSATREAIQQAARNNPDLYVYRPDSINVYVVGNFSGTCAFPPDGDVILIGRFPDPTLLLHECGHFFNLIHTHEGQRSFAADGTTPCNTGCDCPVLRPGEQDGTAETAPDHRCFSSKDAISMNLHGVPFANLDALRQGPINNSWANIMSYHGGSTELNVLTPDQLDRMTDAANSPRRNKVSGSTWYVAPNGNDSNTGLASNQRFRTLNRALIFGIDRDIVLLSAGTYPVTSTLTKPRTLCATRGEVHLNKP